MRTGLTIGDLGDLLDLPLLATLATYDAAGQVRLSPVWFEWWQGGFNIAIPAEDVKARHLRRDPRASVVVAEAVAPMRGVEIRTSARLMASDAAADRRIASRYVGESSVSEFLASIGPGVTVRLEPGELRVWDFADEHS